MQVGHSFLLYELLGLAVMACAVNGGSQGIKLLRFLHSLDMQCIACTVESCSLPCTNSGGAKIPTLCARL